MVMRLPRINSSLKADFARLFSGNAVYSACQWGIVLLLSKFGSPEQVGEYALGIAVSTPVLILANLQVRALVASDVRDQYSFGQYLSFRIATLGLAILVLAGIVAASHFSLYESCVIVVVGIGQGLEYFSETYYGRMQKAGRLDRVSRSLMMKGPLALAALGIAMYLTRSVLWAAMALSLGRLAILLLYDSRIGDSELRSHARCDFRSMLQILWNALPLGMIALLGALSANIPRYFIEASYGKRELGIYSAIAALINIGTIFMNAFGQSVFVPAARAYADADRHKYRELVTQFTFFAAALGAVGVALASGMGRQILAVLYRPEYADQHLLVRLMIAGGITWIGSAQGYILTAIRNLNAQIPVLVGGLIASAAGCYWLVPRYGSSGAADASIFAALVTSAGLATLLMKIDRQFPQSTDEKLEVAEPAVR